jgi:hypothetical protein
MCCRRKWRRNIARGEYHAWNTESQESIKYAQKRIDFRYCQIEYNIDNRSPQRVIDGQNISEKLVVIKGQFWIIIMFTNCMQ